MQKYQKYLNHNAKWCVWAVRRSRADTCQAGGGGAKKVLLLNEEKCPKLKDGDEG